MPPPFPAVASLLARPLLAQPAERSDWGGAQWGALLTAVVLLVPVYAAFTFLPKFAGPRAAALKAAAQPAAVATLKRHDRVATRGGLIGVVADAPAGDAAEVIVDFGGVRVPMLRDHVAAVLPAAADVPIARPADPAA